MTFYNRLDAVMIERILPHQNPHMVSLIEATKNPLQYNIPQVKKIIDDAEATEKATGAYQVAFMQRRLDY